MDYPKIQERIIDIVSRGKEALDNVNEVRTLEVAELLEIVSRDEDSSHQFKANVTNETSLGQEIVAFSNSGGGELYIGVSNDGSFSELQKDDIGRLNQLVSNAASQQVRPPINPLTENIATPQGLVMRIEISDGISKPYMDKNGVIWVKSGADKRKATSREEVRRLYQPAGLLHGDEITSTRNDVIGLRP